ncbi:Stress response NST1-like protein [Quillaja saponaria]|uniref:Stress response NST1-like protein n=1 Tax=Quillaja saponaria TaxID=32244 RepID=A0AAD7Q3L3_QUISA|nr:Stress response NST1-like protein [Quillaja saponaria]
MGSNKGQPVVRKGKKKQVKDELDRLKQAEKKKRRLEKALATSAAIISELEKKKQKKKEEQQRLDEEGAAVAEAVALHVLLGEDSDDTCKVVINEGSCNSWDFDGHVDLFMGGRRACFSRLNGATCPVEGIGWVSDAYTSGCRWGGLGNDECSFSSGPLEKNLRAPFHEEAGWEELSAGLIAAQGVASLQIAEDEHEDGIIF